MTHEGDTSSLGGGAEEGNLGLFIAKDLCVMENRVPGRLAHGCAIILNGVDDANASGRVWLDFVSEGRVSGSFEEMEA